jgi:hypothetical protein
LTKNKMTVGPSPTLLAWLDPCDFSLLPRLKKGRHFDTDEVMKVELQAVLNTLTEHGFQDKKKKLHGLSPRANYTDRATAACRRSDCQVLRIEGATWSAWWIPTAVFSVF